MIVRCPSCEQEFNSAFINERFCSNKCRSEFISNFTQDKCYINKCLCCGLFFVSKTKENYCSKECKDDIEINGLF